MIASFIPQEALFPPQLRVKLSLQDFPLIRKAWGDVSMEELFAALLVPLSRMGGFFDRISTKQTLLHGRASTDTAPMQSRQATKSSPILSRASSFQFFVVRVRSHPSGISPSKNGKKVVLWQDFSCKGIVKLMLWAFAWER